MTSPASPRVLLFDLFGTVVHFAPAVPTVEVAGTRWRSSMGWLRDAAELELPEVRFEDFLATLMAVTGEIVRARPPEYCEVPSRERFRRALVRLGVGAARAPELAERLSVVHMGHLAAQTRLPEDHPTVLRTLASRYRLALVSNFDHGPTAHRILAAHDVAQFFEPIVISAEFGRRKPHAAIFHAALERLDAQPAEAWYVGDSLDDDVAGAKNAGVTAVWINAARETLSVDGPHPDHVIHRLGALPALLNR
jgi:HAD superfamily hydrolase (TIGR01549 family)